jgi:hypothetical protein
MQRDCEKRTSIDATLLACEFDFLGRLGQLGRLQQLASLRVGLLSRHDESGRCSAQEELEIERD